MTLVIPVLALGLLSIGFAIAAFLIERHDERAKEDFDPYAETWNWPSRTFNRSLQLDHENAPAPVASAGGTDPRRTP